MPIQMVIDATSGADLAAQLSDLINGLSGGKTTEARGESSGKISGSETAAGVHDHSSGNNGGNANSGTTGSAEPVVAGEGKPAATAKGRGGSKKKAEPAAGTDAAANDSGGTALFPNTEIMPGLEQDKPANAEIQKKAAHNSALLKPKPGEPVTLPYCQALSLEMASIKGLQPIFKLINSFGAEKAAGIAPEKLPEFANKMLLEIGGI